MNEKGSIKDRLKLWWLIILEKRRKQKEAEQKEREQIIAFQKKNGIRVYSRKEAFFLTFLGLFFGIFEPKNKLGYNHPKTIKHCKQDLKELQNLSENLDRMDKKIDTAHTLNQIQLYNEILEQDEKGIQEKRKKYETIPKNEKALPSVVKAVVGVTDVLSEVEEHHNKVSKKASQKGNQLLKKHNEEIIKNATLIKESKPKTINASTTKKQEMTMQIFAPDLAEEKRVVTTKKGVFLPKKDNIQVQTVLGKIKVQELIQKIEKTDDPILLQKYLDRLEQTKPDTKNMDIRSSAQTLALSKIEEQTRKNKMIKRTEEDLSEILLMEVFILNHIKKQKKELKKFKKKILQLQDSQKQIGFIGGIKNFLNKTIKIAFSLFPLAIFKNKRIGLLTSAILVNNNIRNMRNAIGEVHLPYIEYQNVANKIRKSKSEAEHTRLICEDSLRQVSELKKEFLAVTNCQHTPEIDALLKEMNQLEKMIESRTREIKKVSKNLEKVEKQNKPKIKKLEFM